ncbi:MAG: hypothetical protein JWN76_1284 [Chitinophagaceae bacterium]|nr:hypothetical protein [Chitinophagaceae bacterium]
MKYNLVIIMLFAFSSGGNAQKIKKEFFTREIQGITDNDNYLLQRKDGYYTNGVFFSYTWLPKKLTVKRKLTSLEIGQMIYTDRTRKIINRSEIDRPFTSYLYGRYKETSFSKKDNVLQWSVSAGTMGKSAGGEWLQMNYHTIINIYAFYGWEYQLKDAVGIDGNITYSPVIIPEKEKAFVTLKPVLSANLGTTFTNANLGLMLQAGFFERNHQSALWNARLSHTEIKTRKHFELFGYYHPQLIYHAYNATVQGGLFLKDKGPLTSDIYHLMYQHKLALVYAERRFTVGLAAVYQTKEAKIQKANQRYGSLSLAYRF